MPTTRRLIFSLIALAVVIVVGWRQFRTSPEWHNFTWQAVWHATSSAKLSFLLGAIALIYLSYLLRTLRWSTLMSPHGRFWPILRGTLIGFTGMAIFGRPGEFVRPYYIARTHRMAVSPQLAVWLLERAFDMAATLLLIIAALLLNPSLAGHGPASDAMRHAVWIFGGMIVAVLVAIGLFHRHSGGVTRFVRRHLARSSQSLAQRAEHFLHTLALGTQALAAGGKNLILSSVYTASLWLGVAVAVWLVVQGFPGMLPRFSYAEALLLLGFLLIGSIIQLPAIGGGVQVLIVLGLTEVFGAPAASAASAALLLWLIAFYAVTPLGAALAAREHLSWRRLEHDARLAERGV
ncbi:MAG: lysylphosphatidylglycerol synthase transmembrane domain-containing protein [Terriglobales bacterium]